jgi:LmbE family N-acetylglucosaminyl deacetylase
MTLAAFPDDWRTATVIAAHPDDIEWGIAGAVAAWTAAGHDVTYVLVTSGEAGIDTLPPPAARAAREDEERAAGAVVGVRRVEFLGQPDGRLVEGLELRQVIAGAIRRHRPDVVVAPHFAERWGDAPGAGWNSSDHRAAGRATMDAVSDAANRWTFSELAEEPWAGVRWIAVPEAPTRATHAVDLSAAGDTAVRSLAAHEQYLRALGIEDPIAWATEMLGGQAVAVAEHFGGRPGVAFELVPGPAAQT